MDLTPSQFNILKAFFVALDAVKYNLNKIPPSSIIQGTPINKKECLDLLREFPQLRGKTDNELAEYLKRPDSRNQLFGKKQEQWLEIEKAIAANKTVTTEQTAAAEQPTTAELTTGGSAGGMPGMPAAPSVSAPSIHPVYRTKPPVAQPGEPAPGTKIITPSEAVKGDPSKLVLARSDGSLIEQAPKTTKIALADSSGKITGEHTIPAPGKINPSAFKSKLSNFGKKVQNFASPAGPWFKLNSGRVIRGLGEIAGNVGGSLVHSGLSGAYNAGSRTVLGVINRGGNTYGRLSHLRGSVRRPSWASPRGAMGKRIAIIIFLGLFGTTFLTGFTGLSGTGGIPTPGSSITNPSDISQCKFTRSDQSPKEVNFQSNTLLSFVQEAAQKSGIPPAVLASFIRVESPSTSRMSDTEIANYATNCAESPTGALGIMQIQPPGTKSAAGEPASCDTCIDAGAKLIDKTVGTLTRADYCDPRTSIIVGAGWILKKMSGVGYGNGTGWDPEWTNNQGAIEALVKTYYGCLRYGSEDDVKNPCSDPGRIYSYSDDVFTSIQSCKASTPGTIPPPVADGNYQKWPEGIGIKMADGFPTEVYKWAYEILYQTVTTYPKFKDLIHNQCPLITFEPTTGISHAGGCNIPLSFGSGEQFFKFLIIHELGHKINTTSWKYNNDIIAARKADSQGTGGGFLTYYSEHAGRAANVICGDGDNDGNRSDEDFAESIAYYINNLTKEQNMRTSECGITWPVNPFEVTLANGQKRFKIHYQLMENLLK